LQQGFGQTARPVLKAQDRHGHATWMNQDDWGVFAATGGAENRVATVQVLGRPMPNSN
jgi:hypothetical protein